MSRWKSSSGRPVFRPEGEVQRVRVGQSGRTIDEEEVRAGVLLSPTGEIPDDAVDVGRGGHEHVHRVESRLCLAVTRDRFDDFFFVGFHSKPPGESVRA